MRRLALPVLLAFSMLVVLEAFVAVMLGSWWFAAIAGACLVLDVIAYRYRDVWLA